MIINQTDKTTGAVLCPECSRGSVWKGEDGKMYTSPMARMDVPGHVNALVHKCCQAKIMQRVWREMRKPAKPSAGRVDSISVTAINPEMTEEGGK